MAILNNSGKHGYNFATATNYTTYLQTAAFKCIACTFDGTVISKFHSKRSNVKKWSTLK
jgi:hypothetical protein